MFSISKKDGEVFYRYGVFLDRCKFVFKKNILRFYYGVGFKNKIIVGYCKRRFVEKWVRDVNYLFFYFWKDRS